MTIRHNYSLKNLNTFGIDIRAKNFVELHSPGEIRQLLRQETIDLNNTLILGAGSNILFTGDYDGIIIKPLFDTIRIEKSYPDSVIVSAEAGLEWDKLVEWAVNRELGGLENLSLIPGNVGAAPIQNIGAYGAEVSDCITGVQALSIENGEALTFSNEECKFGYRDSVFKHELKGKVLITRVEFRLKKAPYEYKLTYGGLDDRVKKKGDINLPGIRHSVIEIRNEKLPDYTRLGNAGSFFKNPIIDREDYMNLKNTYEDIPGWKTEDNRYKIPAAWLIEKDGWKGKKYGDAGVHNKHALVLVNHGKASGMEIMEMSDMIIRSVRDRFRIDLEREVNII